MPKRKKKEEEGRSDSQTSDKFQRVEAISRIDDLRAEAIRYKSESNFDDAIICADQIIRLAIQYDMIHYIQEQNEFINTMSKSINQDYLTTQIKDYAKWVNESYDKLVEENSIYQAHEIVESFRERYKDLTFFESIPEVKELLEKDKIKWIKFSMKK